MIPVPVPLAKLLLHFRKKSSVEPSDSIRVDRKTLGVLREVAEAGGLMGNCRNPMHAYPKPIWHFARLSEYLARSADPQLRFLDGKLEKLRQRFIEAGSAYEDLQGELMFPTDDHDRSFVPKSAGSVERRDTYDADIRRLEIEVSEKLGAKVRLDHTQKGAGKLVISYNSLDELDGILKHIK